MAYPPGVQTATLTFSNSITILGNEATRTEMVIQPTAAVVWAATGQPIDDFTENVTPAAGMPGSLTAPFVDQDGMTDQSGNTFKMYAYILTRRSYFGTLKREVRKVWQPLLGQNTVDFDNLPGGSVGLPVAAPQVPVTSVAGETGAVPADALAGALVPFLPVTDVSGKLDVALVGAADGVAPLDAGLRVPDANLPERLAAEALNATYGPGAVASSGLLAPLLGRGLVGFYAALSQRSSRSVNVVVLGDSISEGYGASSREDRYVGRLLANLKSKYPVAGVTGGQGYLPAWYASPNMVALGPTMAGNAIKNGQGSRGLGLRAASLEADVGAGLGSLSFTFNGTSFDMLAAQRVAAGTDSVRIVIDGGAYTEWEVVDGTGTSVWNSGALTPGTHTVSVTARFGAPTIEGFMLYNGDENAGIRIWEGAKSGTRADQFSAASGGNSNWASSITVANPDLVVIGWMTNDIATKTSAQYATNLRNVADLVRSKKANVPLLFMAMYERGTDGLEPWANYVAAMRTVAAEYTSAAFFDLGTHIPKLAGTGGADYYGLLADGIHPTPLGHGLIGDSITSHLTTNGPTSVSDAVVAPPAPGYTPYSLGVAGFSHRYVADQFTAADGSIISAWPDLVSGGSAIGATDVPLATQSGHRYVSAGAGTPALTGSEALAGPITVAMVARRKGTGLIALELANYRIRAASSATTWQASGTGSTTLTGSNTAVWAVVIARLDGANSKLFINGTPPAATTISGPAASGVSDVIRSAFGTTDAASFAEIVTFPSALTDGQIATLQASMAAQYGALIGAA